MQTRLATPEDFPQMAKLIAQINSKPEWHSLHCSQGETEVLAELKDHNSRKECCFLLAFEGVTLVGILGGDCDCPLTEFWLWGPFILSDNWDFVANLLFTELLQQCPNVTKMTVFNNLNSETYRAFFKQKKFKEKKEFTHEYMCDKRTFKLKVSPSNGIDLYQESFQSDFHQLHNAAFPNPYYSTQEILGLIKDENRHKLWLKLDEEQKMMGYLYGCITPNQEGFVHFLAVKHDQRRKGYASELLRTALYWFFEENNLSKTFLTVADANNARKLYEQNGFALCCTGVGARWNREL